MFNLAPMPLSEMPVSETAHDPLRPTIFHEEWWLTIATGGRQECVEVREGSDVVGRLPFYIQKNRLGMPTIELPPLTHFLGPTIVKRDGDPNTQFLHRLDITKQLVAKLPSLSSIYIKCHRDVTDVLAFQDAHFQSGVQFTHEVHPQPIQPLWMSLRDKARNSILSAQGKFTFHTGNDPDTFMKFYVKSIQENKGENNHMDETVHINLIKACIERGRGKIYEARDRKGNLASAIFCAWDNVASYYLMTCRCPTSHGSSTSLLVWEAIKDAVERNLIFDFDGVVSEGGLRAASNFAYVMSPRYTVLRESFPMQLIQAAKSVIRARNYYY